MHPSMYRSIKIFYLSARLSAMGLLDARNMGLAGALVDSSSEGFEGSKTRTKKFTTSRDTGHG